MNFTKFFYFLSIMVVSFSLQCCNGNGKSHSSDDGDTIALSYASNLTMIEYDSFTKVVFRNPWDTTKTLQTFLLVDRNKEMPTNLPKGTVIKVPMEKSIVYTSVHNSLIDELGGLEAISGVCDAKYIHNANINQRLKNGKIVDCGTSMAPNIEQILLINPDAILLSAFENSNDHNKVDQMGIPIIDCADYMETSPLARAEWMRFFGRLYGKGETADSLFRHIESEYNKTKAKLASVEKRPKVLTDLIFQQNWNMPGAYSTTGILIEDAGGKNPFDKYKQSGSVQLSPEEVLYIANDADIWLIKYSQDVPLTISQLARDNNIYTKFVPYTTGNIYGCNTKYSTYYEEASFHPHWQLAELANMLHPELEIESQHNYYSKIEP